MENGSSKPGSTTLPFDTLLFRTFSIYVEVLRWLVYYPVFLCTVSASHEVSSIYDTVDLLRCLRTQYSKYPYKSKRRAIGTTRNAAATIPAYTV